MAFAVRAENISKRYYIGGRQERYKTLRDTLVDTLNAPLRRIRRLGRGPLQAGTAPVQPFWALKDISFEVKPGEVVGLIGHNGAGKSTLLKVLSRITEPTEGRARIRGRVGTLLEVGTGFHPELTGRENVYLNGAILGMTRTEIERQFDQIVDFSGVETFIDTPVKHYSSGMYLRLAFAVAAHLETEILMVDEVLAVGDMQFQNKCIGKMGEVASSGRTVLFVSHNMAAIRQLCNKGIVLNKGTIVFQGDITTATDHYLSLNRSSAGQTVLDLRDNPRRTGIGGAKITAIGCYDDAGNPTASVGIGLPCSLWMDIEFEKNVRSLNGGMEVYSSDGLPLLNLRNDCQGVYLGDFHAGQTVRLKIHVPGLPLYPGTYHIKPWIGERESSRMDYVQDAFQIRLDSLGTLASETSIHPGRGLFLIDCGWSINEKSAEPDAERSASPTS